MAPKRFKHRDVRVIADVRATSREAYQALTSAARLKEWWLERAETDARNGGRFRFVWPADSECGKSEAGGVFADLEPGKKLSWIWDETAHARGVPRLTNVFIESIPAGCRVTVVHAGFPAAASADRLFQSYREGWQDCLAKLSRYAGQVAAT